MIIGITLYYLNIMYMYKYKCHQQTVTASNYLLVTANFMHAVHQFKGEEKYILAYFSVTES